MSKFTERYQAYFERKKEGENLSLLYNVGDETLVMPFDYVIDALIPGLIRQIPGASPMFGGIFIHENIPVFIYKTHSILDVPAPDLTLQLIIKIPDNNFLFSLETDKVVNIIETQRLSMTSKPGDNSKIKPQLVKKQYEMNGKIFTEVDFTRAFQQ